MGENVRPSPAWFFWLWVLLPSQALLLGAYIHPAYSGFRAIVYRYWSETLPGSSRYLLEWFVPAMVGVVAQMALAFPNRRARALTLIVAAGSPLALCAIADFLSSEAHGLLLLSRMIVGAALIAAGNHVQRRFPDWRAPRVMAGLGGLQLLLCFLSEGQRPSKTLLYDVAADYFDAGWPAAAFATGLLGYGVLGASCLLARRAPRMRGIAISAAGYALLLSFPISLYANGWNHSWAFAYDGKMEEQLLVAKFWLLTMGQTILLAVGLAAWMEESRLRLEAVSLDPELAPPLSNTGPAQ